ncbi:zinc finger homeobox protein 4 isoform X2 [Astyanax mexicanus]|uniref:zinc finger homeobox protein 4 isoform X2 n=1 Tax=Astyanax mexicanus TaxID=7994 RepID=UPI0020CB09EC|nr:zinc finger homeobox protein 4 isoform X2 [Astyanax mexicanus]
MATGKGKSHMKCCVVGCKQQHKSLHFLPTKENRTVWLHFIFNGHVPATISKNLVVCANHFKADCFENLGQYRAGLASRLRLTEGSVPTVRGKSADEGDEEPGETMRSDNDGGSLWLCPLCQEGEAGRDALASHLTERHSVLPSCIHKLLDTVVPVNHPSDKDGESSTQSDTNGISQQTCSENTSSPLMASETEGEPMDANDKDGTSQQREVEDERGGVQNEESDLGGLESDQPSITQAAKTSEASVNNDKSVAAESDINRPFKCHACLEFFPTRSALSVHYNSNTHIQRMRTGGASEADCPTLFFPRPYVSNKPYQCAVCRVSYNHAITLESHLKSVLHQSRTRNAGNAATSSSANPVSGSTVAASNLTVTSVANATQVAFATTSNSVTQASLTPSTAMTKDGEQVQPQLAPSLLSSPVASAQAVSAFLTLLTSSPNSLPHSVHPSLIAAGAGATPSTTPPQLIPQPQMLIPLILNGLQTQSPNPESPKQLLQQTVPVLGLSAAQQALLAQGLSGLQSQWSTLGPSSVAQVTPEENGSAVEKVETNLKNDIKQEPNGQEVPQKTKEACTGDLAKTAICKVEPKQECENKVKDHMKNDEMDHDGTAEEESVEENAKRVLNTDANKASAAEILPCSSPSLGLSESSQCTTNNQHHTVNSPELKACPAKCSPSNTNNALTSSGHMSAKSRPCLSSGPPALTEFQSQVLWAFLESRNESDAASPPREDCEALGREVGLSEEEVRKWLMDARHAKECRQSAEAMDEDEMEDSIEDEEGALMIDESEYAQSPSVTSSHAMDLSSSAERHKDNSCLTSDSEGEEFYTSVIVTDEESQSSSLREEPGSPVKQALQVETSGEKTSGGGKVLRSTTVFLSDAEDDEDDDQAAKSKKRKREIDKEEMECKKERQDADLDVQLEAQADPPTPLSVTVDHQSLPTGILQPLPLSLSLAPFSTQLFSPYVLSVPSSVVGVGVSDGDRAKVATFTNPPTVVRSQAPFSAIGSLAQSTRFLSNGNDCESALDLSIGKNHSSTTATFSSSKTSIQKTNLLDGLGLRPTTVGVPADGSLIVVQVKPDTAITIPNSSNSTILNCNNLAKTSTVFMRAAEKVSSSMTEKEKESDKMRDPKRSNSRRFRDMRRSRTIIQADQLDVLYGCYFKDPNPGKHEFEQISEWVHLPKKVVQIWFQNMRARERKGEVRFISDGTLAAVGKPLIKFTWPLTKPIFSSTPKSNPSPNNPGWVSPKPQTGIVLPKVERIKEEKEPQKISIQVLNKPKEVASTTVVSSTSAALKPKGEAVTAVTMVKIAPKAVAPAVSVGILSAGSSIARIPPKIQAKTERPEEKDGQDKEKVVPVATHITVPKVSTTQMNKTPTATSQKHNGLSYWSQKGHFKINTLSREQLGLSTPRPTLTTPAVTPSVTVNTTPSTQSQKEASFTPQHSTPRRPRTHLNCLQLSILQSCYETCAHPNALECEAVGTELGLPLKVVQIWFQNTRAKEKRWRLQQEKMSPNSTDPSKKIDISSGSYLQYNALRANRPILPKPVQLTVLEPPLPASVGQPAGRETLKGKCEACDVEFESRAAARDHVFSPRHLATLRTSNFGQPATLVNNSSSAGSTGIASQSSSTSPASSTS